LYLHTEKQRVNIEKQYLHQTVQTKYKKQTKHLFYNSNITQTSKTSATRTNRL